MSRGKIRRLSEDIRAINERAERGRQMERVGSPIIRPSMRLSQDARGRMFPTWEAPAQHRYLTGSLTLTVSGTPTPGAGLPIVPGASGFGIETRAAYGGASSPVILRVKNLNDSGPDSLRAALEDSRPRVVIFEVSGYITLTSPISIVNSYLTVAGQTAPSPGITIRMAAGGVEKYLIVGTHDVLLQHLRIRPGAGSCNSGLLIYGGNQHNIVLDHLSFSWGQDENLAFAAGSALTLEATVWRCIMAEGLYQAPGSGGCTGGGYSNGHGCFLDNSTQNVAILQSLFAQNAERSPYAKGDTKTYVGNCYIYDCGTISTFLSDVDLSGDPPLMSVIGNYYKRGPSMPTPAYMTASRYLPTGSQLYLLDNTRDGTSITEFDVINGDGIDPRVGSPPVVVPGYVPMASSAVPAFLASRVGARPADRDAVDTRVLAQAAARTGTFIATQDTVGGYPTLAINARALNPPASPHTVQASGYTALEEWLQSYAAGVEN